MTLLQDLQQNVAAGTAVTALNSGASSVTITAPSTCAWSSAAGMRGLTGLLYTVSTATDIGRWSFNADNNNVAISFVLLTPSSNPSGNATIMTIRYSGGVVARVGINSAGKIYMMDSLNTQTVVTSTAPTANTQYRVEVRLKGGSTSAGDMQCTVYNPTDTSSPIATMTHITNANLTANAIHEVELGNSTPTAITFGIADLQLDDGRTTEIGPIIASVNSLRPSSVDSNAGSWTNVGGAADGSAALADESDSTYLQSPDNPTSKVVVLKFNGTLASGQPTVKTRYQASFSSPVTTLQVELLQGPNTSFTQIATRTINPAATSITDHSFQCTSGEAALITDRTNLYVRYTASS